MKTYIVSIWSKVDPWTGRHCRPFLIRTCRVTATSLGNAGTRVFAGATEFIGRVSEMGTDNSIA
jgi:hypothetical protein